jgi:hypothetical protein
MVVRSILTVVHEAASLTSTAGTKLVMKKVDPSPLCEGLSANVWTAGLLNTELMSILHIELSEYCFLTTHFPNNAKSGLGHLCNGVQINASTSTSSLSALPAIDAVTSPAAGGTGRDRRWT